MATHVQHVTRTVVTRQARDIDPKIAGVFAVAGATIGLVVAVVVVTQLLGKPVDPAVIGYVVPAVLAAAVGYIRKSSHDELIETGVDDAATAAAALEPLAAELAPGSKDVIDQVVDGVAYLDKTLRP